MSQPGNLRFRTFDSPHLPVAINDIDQDSLGFLWISSSTGMIRWDGTDAIQLQHIEGDTSSLISNYVHETVISKNGIFWIATYEGLSRYDSKSQSFKHYYGDGPNPVLAGPIVYCINEDLEGHIWVGSRRNGLARLNPETGTTEVYQHDQEAAGSISGNRIEDIHVDSEGRVWVAVKDGGLDLFLPMSNSFKNYPAQPGSNKALVTDKMRDLAAGPDGHIMVAVSDGGISEFDPETETFIHNLHSPEDPNSLSSNQGYSALYDSKGNLWVGTWAQGLNFRKYGSTSFRRFRKIDGDQTSLPGDIVVKIFEDNQGLIWVGTSNGGLTVVDPSMENRFVHFRHNPDDPNSLSSNNMGGIAQVNENELWMGTTNAGLNIYFRDEDRIETHRYIPDKPGGLPNNGVWSILKDSKGRIWVSTSRGISLWNPKERSFTNYGGQSGPPPMVSNRNIISMAEGPDGRIWTGTWGGGLNIFDPETGLFQQMMGAFPTKFDEKSVKALLHTSNGEMWIGGTTGLGVYDSKTQTFSKFTVDGSDSTLLKVGNVNRIIEAPNGDMWIGGVGGLDKFNAQSQTFEHFSGLPGLENLRVLGMALDAKGMLWLSTNNSIKSMEPSTREVKTYSYLDGTQGNDYVNFSSASSGQKLLQFGGSKGLTEINTDFQGTVVHPPVVFTDFRLFNQVQQPSEGGPLNSSIERVDEVVLTYEDYLFSLGFTALDYRKPKSYQYAYRLTGFDENWIYTDQSNRRATFTNVPHGNYLFEVKASLNGKDWPPPATLKVIVLPPWWQTWWARGTFIAIFLLILIAIYRIRVGALRRQKRVLEIQVKERTAEVVAQAEVISLEKSKSEALLLNILPESIAEELKTNEKAETRHFESVSVLFTDFVGFTKIAEQLSPETLVQELDLFFRGFDGIVGRLELEKIKTIGDAYMCASGLPQPNPQHAELLVQAGLEMLEFVEETNLVRQRENRPTWDIRIGVHSGPVVAGVVGNKKFAYDIWGDAVNTASRMESSGEVNHLNISQDTYELVKEQFACSFRGKVHAKNKGEIEMYRVKSRFTS